MIIKRGSWRPLLLVLVPLLSTLEVSGANLKADSERSGLSQHLLHKKHKHHHHHHGKATAVDLTQALAALPVQASELVVNFRSGKVTASAVLDELNAVYARAQAALDASHFQCVDEEVEVETAFKKARTELLIAARAESQVEARISHLEMTKDRILAELQALREQFLRQRDTCSSSSEEDETSVRALEKDLPLATSIVQAATKNCNFAGGKQVGLVECSMADGSSLVTFEDATLRASASNLTALSKRLLSMQLERAVRAAVLAKAGSSLLEVNHSKGHKKHRFRGTGQGSKHHQRRHLLARRLHTSNDEFADSEARRSKSARGTDLPKDICTAATPPSCQSFADNLATFSGSLEDVLGELKARIGAAQTNCSTALNKYRQSIEDLKAQADASSVEIASLLAEKERLLTERNAQKIHLENAEAEQNRVKTSCETAKSVARGELEATAELHRILNVGGSFLGSCQVTEWAVGQCIGECGSTGTRNLTRDVIWKMNAATKCPNLTATRPCNPGACHIDGEMGVWGDWSQCSQACGGGTRSRYRSVVRWPSDGGLPVGETVQEEACNLQSCDQDCFLSKWTEWSSCSKVCDQGHETRFRKIIRPAAGEGTCPPQESLREARACNKNLCNTTLVKKCNVTLDLVFAIDASGTVGADGIAKTKTFLRSFLSKLKIGQSTGGDDGDPQQMVGLLQFGASSKVVTVLHSVAGTVYKGLNALSWDTGPTPTGEAIAVADDMFTWRSRDEADQAIVVITDGAPTRASVLSEEIDRVKASGKRIILVVVGPNLPRKTAIRWASWPTEENLIVVPNYDALATDQAALNLAATLCPAT